MKKIIFALAVLATSFASAQVGVGNTDPKATLDVNKASYATGEQAGIAVTQQTAVLILAMNTTGLKPGTLVYATDTSGIINAVGYWNWNGTAWVKAGGGKFVDGTTATDAVYTSGKVGIGTTSPSNNLDVDNNGLFTPDSNDFASIKLKGSWGGGIVMSEGNNRTGIWSQGGNQLVFGSGGTSAGIAERMRITEFGNVGINTANPHQSSLLDVTSTTQGFLPPRMTSVQMGSIFTPSEGLIVYCLDCIGGKGLRLFDGVTWVNMAGAAVAPASFSFTGVTSQAGDFYQGKVMSGSNKAVVQINVTTAGAITFSSTTANGYQFSQYLELSNTGIQLVELNAAGTQTAYNAAGDAFTITGVGTTTQTQAITITNVQSGASFTALDNGSGEMFSANTTCATKGISTSATCPATVTVGSNTYNAVSINGQCWMASNLKEIPTTGCTAPQGTGCNVWTAPNGAWGFYNNAASEVSSGHGLLYQFGAAMNGSTTERAQGVCPTGWHIPSDCEFKYLEHGLGMTIANQNLDFAARSFPNIASLKTGGASGFNLVFPGRRVFNSFNGLNTNQEFWTSTKVRRGFDNTNSIIFRTTTNNATVNLGFSVRCLKDN